MQNSNYDIIAQAIKNKKIIICDYLDEKGNITQKIFCPHILGIKTDPKTHIVKTNCSCYQFDGVSSSGRMGWKCLHVKQMRNLETHSGPWHSERPKGTGKIACVDEDGIEHEVDAIWLESFYNEQEKRNRNF